MVAFAAISGILLGNSISAPSPRECKPLDDNKITREEMAEIVDRANIRYQYLQREVNAAHERIDKIILAVDAMAPRMKGRARAPRLLDEAKR